MGGSWGDQDELGSLGGGSGSNSSGDDGGCGCEGLLGNLVLCGVIALIVVAAWQDPSGQGRIGLSCIGGGIFFLIVLPMWRRKRQR